MAGDAVDDSTTPYVSPEIFVETRQAIFKHLAVLPGHLHYRRSFKELTQISNRFPSLFAERRLYLQVHHLMATHVYTLDIRREVFDLFSADALKRKPPTQPQPQLQQSQQQYTNTETPTIA